MGCKSSKQIHVEVYRTGMDAETFYTLRVFPAMRTTLFSLNSTWLVHARWVPALVLTWDELAPFQNTLWLFVPCSDEGSGLQGLSDLRGHGRGVRVERMFHGGLTLPHQPTSTVPPSLAILCFHRCNFA